MIRYPAVRIVASSIQDSQIYEGEIRLWQEDDWWIAKDVETGVTTEGDSKKAVLEILDDAVALHNGERGCALTDKELGAAGINRNA